ncbi:radical SAM superfamily enzyme [Burkholderia ubonensis]|nr:radical SAM superfamily enzyme [Burkholderia ubonensis]
MMKAGHLSLEDVKQAIREAVAIGAFKVVHFVGGDPLLHPDLVCEAIEFATSLGLRSGLTTSAFWAKSPARARKILLALKQAGLTEITISYDDAHAEFLHISCVRNAVSTSVDLALKARVAVVVEPGSLITAESLRAALVVDDSVMVYETAINSTGRAADIAESRGVARKRNEHAYRGPCQSVLSTFQIDPGGRVLPCCGVLPHHDAMVVGHLHDGGIQAAVQSAQDDALLQWIRKEGPVEVLVRATANDAVPLRHDDFDGVCTACDQLYSSLRLLTLARALAEERACVVGAQGREAGAPPCSALE